MNRRRSLPVLCLLLCLLLSACSSERASQKPDLALPGAPSQDAAAQTAPPVSPAAPLDQPEDAAQTQQSETLELASLPLPEGMSAATAQCFCKDRVYTGGTGESGAVFGYTCFDRSRETLPLPAPFEFIYAMCPTDGGFAALCGSYPSAYLDALGNLVHVGEDSDGAFSILTFSEDGAFLTRIDLQNAYPENACLFKQMAQTDAGYILRSRGAIIAISPDGAELGRIAPEDDHSFVAIQEADGTIYVLSTDLMHTDTQLSTLDLESFSLSPALVLQEQSVCGLGACETGALLVNNQRQNSVCQIDLTTGSLTERFCWDDVGLAAQAYLEVIACNGGFLLYEPYQSAISYLRPSSGAGRQELLLAYGGYVPIASIVNEFNLSQDHYRVKAVEYGTEDRSMDMLRTEIIAGKAPDLYCFDTPQRFGAAACADLLPFLDADTQTGREWFIPNLLRAMTEDGKLYWMPYLFAVSTWVAPSDVFSHAGISPDEWQARLRALDTDDPLFDCFATSAWFLSWYASFAIGQFVDFDQGTCSFDSPEFAAVLQFCSDWGTDGEISMTPERPVMKFEAITNAARIGVLGELYNDAYCYAGFPTERGNGSMFDIKMCFALSALAEKQDGAWAFLQFAMQRLSQASGAALRELNGLPASSQALETRLQYLIETGDTFLDNTNKIKPSDAEQFLALLDETTVLGSANEEIRQIIEEEAAMFFAGQCSAADAAAKIQNRVSLYLMEQS